MGMCGKRGTLVYPTGRSGGPSGPQTIRAKKKSDSGNKSYRKMFHSIFMETLAVWEVTNFLLESYLEM
jgi:hypothetical protein